MASFLNLAFKLERPVNRMSFRGFCKSTISALLVSLSLTTNLTQAAGQLYFAQKLPERFNAGEGKITLLPDGSIFKYTLCWHLGTRCAADLPDTGPHAEISLWNPSRLQWDSKSVSDYRRDFTSTLTRDGRVVMVGGTRHAEGYPSAEPISSTATYDSKTGIFRTGPNLGEARVKHTVSELPSGDLLVAGGATTGMNRGGMTASAELIAGSWTKTLQPMQQARFSHTATLLPSGDVLVVGGRQLIQPTKGGAFVPRALETVERYEAAHDRWVAMPPLPSPRSEHTATLLLDGRVMIVGGWSENEGKRKPVAASVLLWDPKTGQWAAGNDLPRGRRSQHRATLLLNGDVLVSGGYDERLVQASDLALWNRATGLWVNAGRTRDALVDHSAELLANGNVFLTSTLGGTEMAVWSPQAEKDSPGNFAPPRSAYSTTVLTDGRFLVAGGFSDQRQPVFYAQIFDPVTKHWSDAGEMHYPRAHHRATRLADGRVLVLGGVVRRSYNGYIKEAPAEIWDPKTGQWVLSPALPFETEYSPEGYVGCERVYRNGVQQALPCGPSTEIRGLADGRVLLGIESSTDAGATKEYSYRVWTPGNLAPTQAESIKAPRAGGYMGLLDEGSLLFVGGIDASTERLSPQLDLWDVNSKRWTPAGKLHHAIAKPGILDLGDQRLLIFEQNFEGRQAAAELWDRTTGTTQSVSLPPEFTIGALEDKSRDTNEAQTQDSWQAVSLSKDRILLIAKERSYLSQAPFTQWHPIQNAVKLWTWTSHISVLQNGKVLALAGMPVPNPEYYCRPKKICHDTGYKDEFAVVEFDPAQNQWRAIWSFGEPKSKPNSKLPVLSAGQDSPGSSPVPIAATWTDDVIRTGGPFAFLVAPQPERELKDYSNYPRLWQVVLLVLLIAAAFYWKRAVSRTARNRPRLP